MSLALFPVSAGASFLSLDSPPSSYKDAGMSERPCQAPASPGNPRSQSWESKGIHWPPSLVAALTLAFKLLGRCGEEQLALHVQGPSAAGNARFLVASLHPAGEPAEVAVTVQGIGTNGPGAEAEDKWAFQLHALLACVAKGPPDPGPEDLVFSLHISISYAVSHLLFITACSA